MRHDRKYWTCFGAATTLQLSIEFCPRAESVRHEVDSGDRLMKKRTTNLNQEPLVSAIQPENVLASTVDHLAERIERCVLLVARELAPRAINYGEKLIGDPSVALTLFEETILSVSRFISAKSSDQGHPVNDLHRYLFRAYVNRVRAEMRRQPVFDDLTEHAWERFVNQADPMDTDRRIFVKELLAGFAELTQEIVHRRMEGYSWGDIEGFCGIPANAARLRFRTVLHKLRKAHGVPWRSRCSAGAIHDQQRNN